MLRTKLYIKFNYTVCCLLGFVPFCCLLVTTRMQSKSCWSPVHDPLYMSTSNHLICWLKGEGVLTWLKKLPNHHYKLMVKWGSLHTVQVTFRFVCFREVINFLTYSREIEREEFRKVMALMRSYNRQGAGHSDGRRGGCKVGKSVENGGLLGFFFGNDGNGRLNHDKFVQFLRDLHDEVLACLSHVSFLNLCSLFSFQLFFVRVQTINFFLKKV